MERLTARTDGGAYAVPADQITVNENGTCTGPAIDALARYEDSLELVEQQLAAVTASIDAQKQQGSLKTASAQQLLAQKLTYRSILSALGAGER